MSEIKVNKISQRSGTAITLGNSGTDFQLPSGADIVAQSGSVITIAAGASIVNNGTSTGFGPTGAVTWDTTAKTTGFTAVNGVGYFCNTTSGAFTVTLPATPSAGNIVGLIDYAGTFDTNALTINPNGNKIEGGTGNLGLAGDREGVLLVYVDSTQGWLATSGINEGTDALSPLPYSVDFLVIAGGGGGGNNAGGGGGAGGYRTSTQTVNGGIVITITVGDGGAIETNGSDSSISGSGLSTITSTAGGKGGGLSVAGNSGGSGGGGGTGYVSSPNGAGGSGNTPSTSPSQGNNGAAGNNTGQGPPYNELAGGGAGGAGGTGSVGTNGQGGAGGNGTASSITGSSVTRAGGGGGGSYTTGGSGGTGGGGAGGSASPNTGTNGTANTGGGAGGSGASGFGGTGGKGVVILSMPDANYSGTTTGSPTVATGVSGKTVLTFTGTGSYTT